MIIIPSLKRPGLNTDNINTYRKISNFTYLLIVVERIVDRLIMRNVEPCDLIQNFQSGFIKSTVIETVLLRLIPDTCNAFDSVHVTLLTLLDVSAAFDTVDHTIQLFFVAKVFVRSYHFGSYTLHFIRLFCYGYSGVTSVYYNLRILFLLSIVLLSYLMLN